MASVKPVEYKKDSSTVGFAVAGDKKTITASNANTIQKDIDQGFVNPLDAAQERQLDKYVDEDTLDYSDEEMKNVGTQQIDTKGEDGEELSEKNNSAAGGTAVAAGGVAATAGFLFANQIAVWLGAQKTVAESNTGWVQFVIAGLTLAAAGGAILKSNNFDPSEVDRKNETSAAPGNNDIINGYKDSIEGNMDTMVNESEEYQELCTLNMETTVDTITEIGALQANMHMYLAEGDTARAAEMQEQIDKLQEGNEEDPTLKNMQACKDNLEVYTAQNEEATGVSESGTTVSKFLKAGKPLSNWAKINGTTLGICALACAIPCIPKLAPLFPDAPTSILAQVAFGVSAAMFGVASGIMFKKSGIESDASNAGDEMGTNVENLNKMIESGDEFIGATESGYVEADAEAAETTQEAQEGTDKAVANTVKGAGAKAGAKDDKKKPEEEPIVTTAPPSGAAA